MYKLQCWSSSPPQTQRWCWFCRVGREGWVVGCEWRLRKFSEQWLLPFNYNCSLSEGHILSTVQATFGQAKYLHELYTYNTVPYTCLQLYVHVYSGYINSYCIIIPFWYCYVSVNFKSIVIGSSDCSYWRFNKWCLLLYYYYYDHHHLLHQHQEGKISRSFVTKLDC